MKLVSIVSVLGLATAALATPTGNAAAEAAEIQAAFLEKRAPCPNGPSKIACDQACNAVVKRACASCNGNTSCTIACENARYKSCYGCCKSRCSTC